MPNIEVKLRRGTTAQHSTFTGAEGEVTVDTDKDTVIVHDGTTVGGHELRKKSDTIAGSEIDAGAITSDKISDSDNTFKVSSTDVVINEGGGTVNFRVEGDTNPNLISASAVLNGVGIGGNPVGGYKLAIDGDLLVRDSGDNEPVAIFEGSAGSTVQLKDTSIASGTNNGIYNIVSLEGSFAIGSINDNGTQRSTLLLLASKGTDGGVAQLPLITTANLQAAETGFTAASGMIAYVSDGDSGSPCLAVHDGSSFKRVALGTTISAT